MKNSDLETIIARSKNIRDQYHALERQHHGSEWTVEEDALAYLTDAGLVGRLAMSQQQRWPTANTEEELKHKLGENIWWLIVLADRMNIDLEESIETFLTKTERLVGG